jgi:hypothetical protein
MRALSILMGLAGVARPCSAEPDVQATERSEAKESKPPTDAATAAAESESTTSDANRAVPKDGQQVTVLKPRVIHPPVSVTSPHEALKLVAQIENPHLVRRAYARYVSRNVEHRVEFQRSPRGDFAALIPAQHVDAPRLSYWIELERADGAVEPVFASRQVPQPVIVPPDRMDTREQAVSERLDGRRSVFSLSGEYVDFGFTDVSEPGQDPVRDSYYRVEGGYAYRPLRAISEFGLRIGIVRGQSAVPLGEDQVAPGTAPEDRMKVGLNYGAPYLRVRAHDFVHFDAEFLTSVTEVGFSVGTGGAVLLGDPYANHLAIGFESIQVFGTRFFSRMEITAADGVTLAPIIEVTDMPHANKYGVRLLAELGLDLGSGFGLSARGGYQAREHAGGGPSGGLEARYAF